MTAKVCLRGTKKIKVFRVHPKIKGAVIPTDVIKVGDEVTMYGRGNPKGTIIKVDRRYKKGGSIWYEICKTNGEEITLRAWDFKEVLRCR